MALDCASQDATPIPLNLDNISLLVIHSGVSHALAEGAYAQRRLECDQAAEGLGVSTLREVVLGDIDRLASASLRKRVRHVVTENARVQQAVAAIQKKDWGGLGALMTGSHASLRMTMRCHAMSLTDWSSWPAQSGCTGCAYDGRRLRRLCRRASGQCSWRASLPRSKRVIHEKSAISSSVSTSRPPQAPAH